MKKRSYKPSIAELRARGRTAAIKRKAELEAEWMPVRNAVRGPAAKPLSVPDPPPSPAADPTSSAAGIDLTEAQAPIPETLMSE